MTKEIVDHVRSRRFTLGAVMSIVLCLLATYVRVADYREAHQERNLFLQRWTPSVLEQLERDENVEVENARAASPASVLAVGLEPVTPFRFTSTKEGLKFGQSRGAQNAVDALFGYLDMNFIVSVLLSLLCLALTFDSVCGERADGTLALLLSYPVERSTFLLAKICANIAVAAISFMAAFVMSVLFIVISGISLINAWHWVAFAAVAMLYLLFFVSLGVAISASRQRPVDAALTAVFLWVMFVFVVPRGVGLLVNVIRPPTKMVEIGIREDEALSSLRTEYVHKLDAAFDAYINGGADIVKRNEDFDRARKEAAEDLRKKRRTVLGRMWDFQAQEEGLRERYLRGLSTLSPAALFQQSAAELAWTGSVQRRHFVLEARTYDEKIGRRLAESRESFYTRSSENRGSGRALVIHDDIRPFLIPFQPTWTPSREILLAVAPSVGLLVLFTIVTVLLGRRALERMDVRL